ncbi:DNA (cytosine-5)-methyltransferase [Mycena venus]|uniref:DNA (Cytosine-5)-methyltransferase n=1 Tax=Mycena venus TaxID=2733690 RepID=A0A8H7DAD2_9AGAR|nr:DNA (cytosine-5)-methyltransferase [Mycena venus]
MAGRGVPYVLVPPGPSYLKRNLDLALGSSLNPSPQKQRKRDSEWDYAHSASGVGIGDHWPEHEDTMIEEKDLEMGDLDLDPGDIPVRKLSCFCIRDSQNLLVEMMELLGVIAGHSFTASGLVRAHHVDSSDDEADEEEDEDNYGFVKGLEIMEFDVHHVSEDGSIDRNVYIRTSHAWYILDTPSLVYRQFFEAFSIRHDITHLIVSSAIFNPKLTFDEFVASLPKHLTESQLRSTEMINYFSPLLVAISRDLSTVSSLNINTVPLIKALKMAKFSKHLDIPKMSTGTVLTPNIARVVGQYINGPIRVVGSDLAKADRVLHKRLTPCEHDHPTLMRWGSTLGYPRYYESVVLDGDTFGIGDIVSVKPGVDGDEERAKSAVFASKCCVNSYARCVWFIKIEYFFDDEMEKEDGRPTKMLHGTWLVHGSDTILQEVTHSQELFMLEECDNIKVSSIYRKCDVRKLDAGEIEHPDEGDPQADTFFYQLIWDALNCEFRDTPSAEDERRVKSFLPEHRPCTNCGFAAEDALHRTLRPIGPVLAPNGFTQFGHKYHKGDFIYLRSNTSSAHPLLVAQITAIDGLQSIDVKEDDIVCYIRQGGSADPSPPPPVGNCLI